MEYRDTENGRIEKNAKGFVKYYPNIKVRTSNLDTFISCPLQSTLPFDMDVFTANIGHMLHYAHQQPGLIEPMVREFMNEYKDITGEENNELRDMLLLYVHKGMEFLELHKDHILIREPPLNKQINGVWVDGHPDVIIIEYEGPLQEFIELSDNTKKTIPVHILDFKSSQSPGTFADAVNVTNVSKAQPYFYTRMVCELLGIQVVMFQYLVYSKAKSVKLHIHGDVLTYPEVLKITNDVINDYKSCEQTGMFYPKKCGYCFMCPLGPKGNNSCPLYK